uniref:hypothetical protein n=1 Tax=Brachyspira catarrhinii TaxID=2528966 RepID=UPI003F4BFD20
MIDNHIKNLYYWLGLAWLGLAWLGLAWLGLAWLGLAWLLIAKQELKNNKSNIFLYYIINMIFSI